MVGWRDNVLDEGAIPREGGGLRPGKAAGGGGEKEGGTIRGKERGEPEESRARGAKTSKHGAEGRVNAGAGIDRLNGSHTIKQNMDRDIPGVVVGRRGEVRVGGVHANIGQGEVGLKGGVDIHHVWEQGKRGVGEGGSDATLALISEVRGPGEGAKDVRRGVKGKEKLSDKALGLKGAA